ncbi:WecB/TagA/CpsF family glycosyltransferase [Sorangium sp. So ce854]|uniref:WecB/TagA/CpsF family glycosyltransferase n=1 Tax=Sorangium sp. So ce854 TaxID=3133322 RepID=UPI003F5F6DFD
MTVAPSSTPRVDVLGVPVARLTFERLLLKLDEALRAQKGGGRPEYYTYVNAYCATLAAREAPYRAAVADADVVYADGIGVVWATRLLGGPCPERINVGPIELGRIVDLCAERGASVFLLGGAPGIADEVARRLAAERPGLRIAGVHHGYFAPEEEAEVVRKINDSGAALLIVGLGPPKQEQWVSRHLPALRVHAAWCMGGLLDQVAGAVAYPPEWVRRHHVQWLYRLVVEPRRLWRRYLLGIPEFIGRVALQRLRLERPT